jgi:heme/copper-type cytochrome/quinol oxidase subunit 3
MSVSSVEVMPSSLRRSPLPVYDGIGDIAIKTFIATEATLFAMFFASYWYLGKGQPRWPMDDPPKLHYAIPMLVVLLASSGVLHWGEKQIKRHRFTAGIAALVVTIIMGLGFIVLSILEYEEHLQTLKPTTDAYGSIFYTTVTFHAAHLVLGLCMLLYVLLLPSIEPRESTPYRPYHNAALYWHFVDTVWLFVVIIFYIIPNAAR